jgi:hypothetical protein
LGWFIIYGLCSIYCIFRFMGHILCDSILSPAPNCLPSTLLGHLMPLYFSPPPLPSSLCVSFLNSGAWSLTRCNCYKDRASKPLTVLGTWRSPGICGISLGSCKVLATVPSGRLRNIRSSEWLDDTLCIFISGACQGSSVEEAT